MVDFASLATIVQGVQATLEIGKAAKGVMNAADESSRVVQMNEQLVSIQGALMTHQVQVIKLLSDYQAAEAELRQLKEQQSDRARYKLKEVHRGTFVYALKPEAKEAGEPDHLLCPTCFDQRQRSILHETSSEYAFCKICKSSYQMRGRSGSGYAEPDY